MSAWLRRITTFTLGCIFLLQSQLTFAASKLNLHKGVTPVAHEIYHLHMIVLWVCVAIGVIVFGIMLFAMIFHRKSKGHKASEFHESVFVEILWTVVPFLILFGLAIPATKVLINMYNTDDSAITVKVTGYQWKWGYDYINEGISFISNLKTDQDEVYNKTVKNDHYLLDVDNELVLPVGKKIRFLTTSNDVIHSFYIPEFGLKKDAIPGFINETWAIIEKPGIYRGQCAELCGANHGYMPVVVRAVSPEAYAKWVQEKTQVKQPQVQTSETNNNAPSEEETNQAAQTNNT